MTSAEEQRLVETKAYWDDEAITFDNEPDHGLRSPEIYQAWQQLLTDYLPVDCSKILDIGCGTGTISVLLSRLGHTVTGVDLSPAMLGQAQAKALASDLRIDFAIMDAAYPDLSPQKYDVVFCRHVLWSLPQPGDVLHRWTKLLVPRGRFILIEGYWHTGGGLHADDIVNVMPSSMSEIQVIDLSHQMELWGAEVNDERYMIIADNINN